jgi:hypothetical protein
MAGAFKLASFCGAGAAKDRFRQQFPPYWSGYVYFTNAMNPKSMCSCMWQWNKDGPG